MTTYNVKTTFPVNEDYKNHKTKLTRSTELLENVEAPDVLKLYTGYLEAGYNVNFSFDAQSDNDAEEIDYDPFTVAENLTKQGIDYKATLKLKAKGEYNDLLDAMHLIETSGYNMTVTVKLKINEKTSLNIDDPASWTDSDSNFSINPTASSKNILELKDLYENLQSRSFDATIDIKPKIPKDNDMDSTDDSFAILLNQYPENTLVKFTLSDSEN